MAVLIKRKEGENLPSFLYRATRRIQKSGILLEARKTKFHHERLSKTKKWGKAMHRVRMQREINKFLKIGYPLEEAVALARKIIKGIVKKQ